MKKLFAMLALAAFSLAMTSCNNQKDPDPTPSAFTLAADKTTAAPGDQIIFTITGDLTGKPIGMCDQINQTCNDITNKIVNGKYTYQIVDTASAGTYDFYAQINNADPLVKTNTIKITINKK